ncbi:MAG: TAT-variant-translocated molybdopterin oxidoreductase, partial [Phycisphaerae bacterium]|nr:TAT-variant-translocated molybdopterin oxidoreductase [Phycisphaerae bacterium]
MHDGCNDGQSKRPTSGEASASSPNANAASTGAPSAGATTAGAPSADMPARRSAYWRSYDEVDGNPEFQAFLHREFQPGAAELEGDDRRHFIKIMGASFALA